MSWVLKSAASLAEVLEAVRAGQWDAATADRYRRTWADRIGRRQRLCGALAGIVARPRACRVAIGIARRASGPTGWLVRRATVR